MLGEHLSQKLSLNLDKNVTRVAKKQPKVFWANILNPKKQSAKIIFPSWSYKRLKFDLFEAKFPHYDPVNSLS